MQELQLLLWGLLLESRYTSSDMDYGDYCLDIADEYFTRIPLYVIMGSHYYTFCCYTLHRMKFINGVWYFECPRCHKEYVLGEEEDEDIYLDFIPVDSE